MNVRLKIFRGGTVEDKGSLMQDHYPCGKGSYFFGPMRSEQYRLSQRMNSFQQKVDLLGHVKIEPRSRLIKEKQRWIGKQRASDADPLFQPFRQHLNFILTKREKVEFLQLSLRCASREF